VGVSVGVAVKEAVGVDEGVKVGSLVFVTNGAGVVISVVVGSRRVMVAVTGVWVNVASIA